MNRKVIITGVTGQTGSYMADYLIENTNHIIIGGIRRTSQAILSNIKHLLNNSRFSLHTLDITDPHAVDVLIEKEKPNYFLNFAASTFVADSWDHPSQHMITNAVSVIHILEAIKKHVPSCRFYNAGSSEEFADCFYVPQDEKHPSKAKSIYGASKISARQICKVYRESYNLYCIQGLLYNHESPRRQNYFITKKITEGVARIYHAIKNNKGFEPIEVGNIDSKRDWSFAGDFVDGIWRMMNQEIYNEDIHYDLTLTVVNKWNYLIKNIKEYVLSSNETHLVKEFIELSFQKAGIINYKSQQEAFLNNCQFWGEWIDSNEKERYCLYKDDGNCISFRELVKINPKYFRPADVNLLHGNSNLARKELGWEPKVSFNQLVERMVKYDIENYKE